MARPLISYAPRSRRSRSHNDSGERKVPLKTSIPQTEPHSQVHFELPPALPGRPTAVRPDTSRYHRLPGHLLGQADQALLPVMHQVPPVSR